MNDIKHIEIKGSGYLTGEHGQYLWASLTPNDTAIGLIDTDSSIGYLMVHRGKNPQTIDELSLQFVNDIGNRHIDPRIKTYALASQKNLQTLDKYFRIDNHDVLSGACENVEFYVRAPDSDKGFSVMSIGL